MDDDLLHDLYTQLTPGVPRLGPDATAAVCVALAHLSAPGLLPRELHERLLAQVHVHLDVLSCRSAANITWALSVLARHCSGVHLRSGLELLPRLAAVARRNMADCNASDLAQFAEAFARVSLCVCAVRACVCACARASLCRGGRAAM